MRTLLQWPQAAARCVYCREWERYGDAVLVEVRRDIGLVYAHAGCEITFTRNRLRSTVFVHPLAFPPPF